MDQTIGKVKAFGFVILQLFPATFYPVMACSQKTEAKVIKTIDGNTTAIADVEKYLSGQMDSLKIPGLSIAIINKDPIVYSRNMGVKNMPPKEPAGRVLCSRHVRLICIVNFIAPFRWCMHN